MSADKTDREADAAFAKAESAAYAALLAERRTAPLPVALAQRLIESAFLAGWDAARRAVVRKGKPIRAPRIVGPDTSGPYVDGDIRLGGAVSGPSVSVYREGQWQAVESKASSPGPYSIGSNLWPGLSKLIEECGEVMQVAGKLLGTGGALGHWDGSNLKERLEEEIADVIAACRFVILANGLNETSINDRVANKLAVFCRWHVEQSVPPKEQSAPPAVKAPPRECCPHRGRFVPINDPGRAEWQECDCLCHYNDR